MQRCKKSWSGISWRSRWSRSGNRLDCPVPRQSAACTVPSWECTRCGASQAAQDLLGREHGNDGRSVGSSSTAARVDIHRRAEQALEAAAAKYGRKLCVATRSAWLSDTACVCVCVCVWLCVCGRVCVAVCAWGCGSRRYRAQQEAKEAEARRKAAASKASACGARRAPSRLLQPTRAFEVRCTWSSACGMHAPCSRRVGVAVTRRSTVRGRTCSTATASCRCPCQCGSQCCRCSARERQELHVRRAEGVSCTAFLASGRVIEGSGQWETGIEQQQHRY